MPQRDMLDRGFEVLECVPGLEREAARHPFRDVHDDLVLTANELIAYTATVARRVAERARSTRWPGA